MYLIFSEDDEPAEQTFIVEFTPESIKQYVNLRSNRYFFKFVRLCYIYRLRDEVGNITEKVTKMPGSISPFNRTVTKLQNIVGLLKIVLDACARALDILKDIEKVADATDKRNCYESAKNAAKDIEDGCKNIKLQIPSGNRSRTEEMQIIRDVQKVTRTFELISMLVLDETEQGLKSLAENGTAPKVVRVTTPNHNTSNSSINNAAFIDQYVYLLSN